MNKIMLFNKIIIVKVKKKVSDAVESMIHFDYSSIL